MATAKEIATCGLRLREAAKGGVLDEVKSILKACPECKDKKNVDGKTALMMASGDGHIEIVKELIALGANIEEDDKFGFTALFFTVSSKQIKVLKELINSGANIDKESKFSGTALIVAAGNGSEEFVKILLAAGADIAIADKDGRTALQKAEDEGRLGCIWVLQDAKDGKRPSCNEVGILPPEARVSKFEVERRWTSRVTAEVGKNEWVIE